MDRYQEALSPSYAKYVLGEYFNPNYDYFLIISLDKFVISGINKKDPTDVVEKVYDDNSSYEDRDVNLEDFVECGGTLESFMKYKNKGKAYMFLSLLLPFITMLLFCVVLFMVFR